MSFMQWIIQRLSDASGFFYALYLEVYDWVWPFWLAARFFYDLSSLFANLAWDFVDFDDWLEWAADEIGDILSWSNIRSLIRGWLGGIEDLVDWFANWWDWIRQKVDEWWSAVSVTVKGWIAIAVKGLDDLIAAWDSFWNITWPELLSVVNSLRAAWDNFWTTIFPTLVSFAWLDVWWKSRLADIDLLFETWTKKLAPFWEGWQEVKEKVVTFIADPLEWLANNIEDWFWGKEEK